MKLILVACVFLFATVSCSQKLQCELSKVTMPTEWVDMVPKCIEQVRRQIKMEVSASIQYLMMGAHFSQDTINRPGFAKFFFEAASEERGHAIKLISYLLNRGELTNNVSDLISVSFTNPEKITWINATSALWDALELETKVTKSIAQVIKVCEDTTANTKQYNDYELVDYLTGEFLKEQYEGQRDLAGKLSTLQKVMKQHGPLGEFLYDKTLL